MHHWKAPFLLAAALPSGLCYSLATSLRQTCRHLERGSSTCNTSPNRGRCGHKCLPGYQCFCAHYGKQIQLQFIPDQQNAVLVNIIILSYIVIPLKIDTSLNSSNCPSDPSLGFCPQWCLPKYPDQISV